jgi:AsmA protein
MRRLARLAAVLLIVLALALTPPLLNVERLRHRIAASMSESLGRPVHIDSVTLHLLPMPGFTLTNVVVSEDPEFGSEPTIRAMTVEATLRPSSLWRRQVEISKVKFVEPSLNLVRNSQGRWNLQSLLMHAAGVPTAPTEQVKAGPAPRFPYIEATNGRVNLKMGEEKKAFSLTDADFALWLPSPQIWRVRLVGKPARTDTSITDPGEIRLEGSLERAATMTEVPVDLRASWHSAPLGEASKVLTGADAGWRGMLTVDAELVGPLGSAKLATKVTLNELRRADFVPARSLDLQADCTATVNVATAVATSPQCQLPVAPAAGVSAVADSIDLTSLRMTGLRVGTPGLDEDWLLDWARLFLQKIPTAEHTGGIVQGSLVRAGDGTGWQGSLEGTVPTLSGRDDATRAGISLMGGVDELVLAPTNLVASGSAPLILSGSVSAQGYTLTLAGTGTVAQVRQLMGFLPPVGEGLEKLVEDSKSDVPQRMDFTCSRAWGGSESCASNVAAEQKGRGRR